MILKNPKYIYVSVAALLIAAAVFSGCGRLRTDHEYAEDMYETAEPGDADAAESHAENGAVPEETSKEGFVIDISNDVSTPEEEGKPDEAGDSSFTMVFVGDVLLQSNITAAYDDSGIDGIISDELLSMMLNADLTMVNEEFPFGTGGEKAADKQFTFRVDPSYAHILNELGVDIVSLANNHVLDYGKDVLSTTFDTLDNAGIAYVGAGESLEEASAWESFEIAGKNVAVLSASRVIPVVDWDVKNSRPGVFTTYDETVLVSRITEAKKSSDFVIVYVHWGIEKAEEPEDYQRQLARAYIDAGADLVIGAHPHVLQGIEYYEGVPIVYSLGNFMFNETIQRTMLLTVNVDDTGLSLEAAAAAARSSRTFALTGTDAAELYEYLESISFGVSVDDEGHIRPE